jgi:hypothetical protein
MRIRRQAPTASSDSSANHDDWAIRADSTVLAEPDAVGGERMLRDIPLRARIVLGILFCGLIPLFIVSLVSFNAARTELKNQAFRQLQSVRDIKITVLQKFYFERRADVRVFAANPYIRQAYEALNGHDARAARVRYAPFLKALIREYEYRDLFLLRPDDGTIVYSNSGETMAGEQMGAAAAPGLDEAWRSARNGELGISDLRLETGAGESGPAQYLAAPIRADGATVAIVAVELAPDAIESIVRERSGMGATGVTFLTGPDGRPRAPLRSGEDSLDAGTAGRAADAIIVRAKGTRVLSSSAPVRVQGLPWTMFAEIDENEIDNQIPQSADRPADRPFDGPSGGPSLSHRPRAGARCPRRHRGIAPAGPGRAGRPHELTGEDRHNDRGFPPGAGRDQRPDRGFRKTDRALPPAGGTHPRRPAPGSHRFPGRRHRPRL